MPRSAGFFPLLQHSGPQDDLSTDGSSRDRRLFPSLMQKSGGRRLALIVGMHDECTHGIDDLGDTGSAAPRPCSRHDEHQTVGESTHAQNAMEINRSMF
jgi:hypothetical protein